MDHELFKKLESLELKAHFLSKEILTGSYKSAFKGSGMEFAQLRAYAPGDDARFLDWKVFARKQKPYIREFEEDRELRVYFLVDASASLRTNLKLWTLLEEILSLLALLSMKSKDKFSLVLFSNDLEFFIPLGKGQAHFYKILEGLKHNIKNKGTNISSALNFLSSIEKNKSCVFLLSDFLDPNFESSLKTLSKNHELSLIHFKNTSKDLPKGFYLMQDAELNVKNFIQKKDLLSLADIQNISKYLRLAFIEINNSSDPIIKLKELFHKREMLYHS